MRSLLVLLLAGNLVCGATFAGLPQAGTGGTAAKTYDVASFQAELRYLDGALVRKPSAKQLERLSESLPPSWSVATPETTYSIPTAPLKGQLAAGSSEKASEWIQQLEGVLEGAQTNGASPAAARAELNHILAEPQFAAERPPNAWDKLRQRIYEWVDRILAKFFGGIARHPIGAEILFWILLVGAVAFVALMLFRFLSGRDRVEALQPASTIVTQRSWQEWLRAARQAANRGDFREAVHSAYWAGIGRLEEMGAVPRDRAKTPREYLRLVRETREGELEKQLIPKEPLVALTWRLEQVWYANQSAGPADFQDSLRQLQELGCPLE